MKHSEEVNSTRCRVVPTDSSPLEEKRSIWASSKRCGPSSPSRRPLKRRRRGRSRRQGISVDDSHLLVDVPPDYPERITSEAFSRRWDVSANGYKGGWKGPGELSTVAKTVRIPPVDGVWRIQMSPPLFFGSCRDTLKTSHNQKELK